VKLPESVPVPEIEHTGEEAKRPDGEDDRVHVAPAKFDPEAVTAVPEAPWVGLKVSVVAVTVKVAVADESLATFVVADTV
jgi:hypothetical protein